jgi:hypothetical protein
MTDSANVTAELSAYIAGEKAPPLPLEIIARGKTHILDTRGATRDLGSRYELADTGIKVYPAGQPMQATLTAYFKLMKENTAVRRLRNPHNLPDVTGLAESLRMGSQ